MTDILTSNQCTESPPDHFLGWYSSLPPEQQKAIATGDYFIPGFDIDVEDALEKGNEAELFVDRVMSYRDRSSRERRVATVLHLCLEHMAFAGQGTGTWREQQAALRELADELEYPELHDKANAAQFKHAQWVQIREKWNRLKAGQFSLDAISNIRAADPSH
jgi:hypothetical protein